MQSKKETVKPLGLGRKEGRKDYRESQPKEKNCRNHRDKSEGKQKEQFGEGTGQ